MANDTLTPGADSGAAADSGATQDAGSQSQDIDQGQQSEQGLQVDNSGSGASSTSQQGRQNQNPNGRNAELRIFESKFNKKLDAIQTLLSEKLSHIQPPAANASPGQDGHAGGMDFSSTDAITQSIRNMIQSELSQFKTAELPKFKKEFKNEFQTENSMQEARKYLISQKDISGDQDKLDEIQRVMEENLLHYALSNDPLGATQRAVDLWRKTKANPNAPRADQLTMVGGGQSQSSKTQTSMQKIKELQRKVVSGLPESEAQKVYAEIDAIMKSEAA